MYKIKMYNNIRTIEVNNVIIKIRSWLNRINDRREHFVFTILERL